MDSAQNDTQNNEIQEEDQIMGERKKLEDYIPIYIPAIDRGLLNNSRRLGGEERFLDFLKAQPSKEWFQTTFERKVSNVNASPASAPPTNQGNRHQFRVPFARRVNWGSLWRSFKKWIKGPEHIAFFIWLLFVAAGIFMLFLVMTGILNGAIPSRNLRNNWSEVINQILNALFTMMALYEHPKLFHHLILLLRWNPGDKVETRKVYCKNGVSKPNERAHMLFVVMLLHVTCFSQYVLCGLYWAYTRSTRPSWAENTSIGVGIAAPVIALVYTLYSPLGRANDEPPVAEELHEAELQDGFQHKIIITSPEWIGGLFDCRDDPTATCLSFSCTCCVFGWNMERLGFGNMYVHIITFLLLTVAPFWVFAISAINVDDDTIEVILVVIGSLLCILGLFYGGFWRREMRNKFKLPVNAFCCGSAMVTDYIQWLFCGPCSLAQEVRTANFYDIEDDGFYSRVTDGEGREVLIPLPVEGLRKVSERSLSCPAKIQPETPSVRWPIAFERALTYPVKTQTVPPFPHLIRIEEERPAASMNTKIDAKNQLDGT